MKRSSKVMLSAALATLLAASVIATVSWTVATTQGTRWLLTSLAPLSGISFSAGKIEGRLIDRLLLTGVRVGLAQQKVEIDSLQLSLNPLPLLTGTLALREVTLQGVRIQDDAPLDTKKELPAWPRVQGAARFLSAKIARLRVTGISYRRLQETPVTAASLAGSLSWENSQLSLTEMKLVSPSGNLNGSISAGFGRPSLSADLAVSLAQPVAQMDRFSLLIRPADKWLGLGRFVGAVTLAGRTGTRQLLELTGEVAMARKAFDLRRLRLTSPGRKGVLSAKGSLELTGLEPVVKLQVQANGLDLAPELNLPTDLSGTLRFAGTPESYRGELTIANKAKGWQAAVLSSPFQGNREGLKVAPLTGSIIGGSLSGGVEADWRKGLSLSWAVNGSKLDPARVAPDWKGVANFTAQGQLAFSGKAPLTGKISGTLLESRLHGEALTGELLADFAGDNLSIARLVLKGQGFELRASGQLNQRLSLAAQISDFSRLIPGSTGTLRSTGWVRLSDGKLSGALSGTGKKLSYAGAQIAAAELTARLEQGSRAPLQVSASLRKVAYDHYAADAVTLTADGTLARHTVQATLASGAARARLKLSAGYQSGAWKGELTQLAGRDRNGPWQLGAPAAFAAGDGKISLAPVSLTAGASERLQVAADLKLNPLTGQLRAQWSGLNLARANPYLKDMQITGTSGGSVRLGLLPEKRVTLAASATGRGTFTGQGQSITFQRSLLTVDGGEKGVRAALELAMADGGHLQGSFSSAAPLGLALPGQGELTAEARGVDLALIKPWLPDGTKLEGRLSGTAKGITLPGERFELSGKAALSGGTLHQASPEGEVKLAFTAATASWGWREKALTGTLSLTMAEYGKLLADFQLPLAARFPVAMDRQGALRASLKGRVREKGIITAMFPGLVRESFGELDADLDVGGSWETPLIGGTLRLSNAGAYLPAAGIRLKEILVAARLEKNLIRIDSFRAVSGTGHIEGTALLTMAGWRLAGYQGTVRGENFQTVFSPELRMLSTPDLSFEGTPERLKLRGELRLPEMHIRGARSNAAVAPSPDAIRVGRVATVKNGSPLALDVSVRVVLGERVFVKAAGIDAQLDGAVQLSFSSLDRITSSGQLRVVKGHYRTYGVDLEIVRGRLFFAGGPIDRPTLDVLALRTLGEVRAGVLVSGNLKRPVTKLYSEPAMPDVDVLSYVVLGHPIGSNGDQAGLVAQAAGALLTSGQAATLQEQLRTRLGLSTLEVRGGVGGSTSRMGYKPLQVTAPGSIPTTQESGITETMLTVGKYLTPELYVSYGKSLFTGSNLFRLRWDISKRWQIETEAGSESGADLFYKFEFK